MATIDELIVKIDASTELLRRELKKGEGQVADFERKTGGILDKADKRWASLGKGIRTALGFLGVGLSLRGIQQTILSAVRFGDAIEDASKAANVSAESLQELRFAFDQLGGVAAQQTDTALQRFTKTLGDAADGTGEAVQAFQRLGIQIRGAGGAIRDNEQVLDEALRQLAAIDSDAVRAARAAELFGREAGPKLAAALSQGIAAVDELRAKTPGLISNDNVRLAAELNDEFTRMANTVGGALKNAFIEATARAGDFFGLVDLSEQAEILLEIRELERQIERINLPGGLGARDLLPGIEADLAEARRRLQVERARAAGVGGFATRSFLNVDPALNFIDEYEQFLIRAQHTPLIPVETLDTMEGILDVQMLSLEQAQRMQRLWSQIMTPPAGDLGFVGRFRESGRNVSTTPGFDAEYSDFLGRVEAKNRDVTANLGKQWEGLSQTMHFALTDTLADAFLGIETDWGDMLRRMAAQLAASAIIKGIGGAIGGPFGAFIAGGIAGRAGGGPVSAGRSYVVGEDRPEVFKPNLSGTIYPSVGGGSVVVNQHIHFDTALEAVDARIYRAAPMIARATEAKINESRSRRQ